MYLIATQELTFREHGNIPAGEMFEETNERDARKLIERGHAREAYGHTYEARVPHYETAVVRPEVRPLTAEPFRNASDSHEEQTALGAVSRAVRAATDVQEPGDSDTRGRRGRKGPDPK